MKKLRKNEKTNKVEKLTLEAPWYSYCKKLQALFELDPDIRVGDIYENGIGDNYDYGIDIEVRSHKKYLALTKVLPEVRQFGNVSVEIIFYDEENEACNSDETELYNILFEGNPIVKDIKTSIDQVGIKHGFVRFVPEVIQFFDDNLQDYSGNWSGLAQDIAREVFEPTNGLCFCTADLREEL